MDKREREIDIHELKVSLSKKELDDNPMKT